MRLHIVAEGNGGLGRKSIKGGSWKKGQGRLTRRGRSRVEDTRKEQRVVQVQDHGRRAGGRWFIKTEESGTLYRLSSKVAGSQSQDGERANW